MQKKLIAAAVAGLLAVPAMAQTNVTISGRVAMGWENYDVNSCSGLGGAKCNNESRVSDQSSRLIFGVNEDLGGGLKAWAQFDFRGAPDTGGLSNSGNSGIGLSHNTWGKFTIGRWDVHYQEFEANIGGTRAGSLQTMLGNGIMSQVWDPNLNGSAVAAFASAQTVGVGSRTNNLLMWDSPNWNGFTGRIGYSTAAYGGEGTGVTKWATGVAGSDIASGNPGGGSAWTAALRYNNGPWVGGYSHWSSNSEDRRRRIDGTFSSNQNDLRSDRIWAGYKFAMGLDVGFGYDWSKNSAGQGWLASGIHPVTGGAVAGVLGANTKTTFKRKAWMIPVKYNFGPHAIYGTYARASDSSNTPGVNTGAKAWMLGYDYAFSKRTSMGIFYTKLDNDRGGNYNLFATGASGATPVSMGGGGFGVSAATGAGADVRQWYLGMAHNF